MYQIDSCGFGSINALLFVEVFAQAAWPRIGSVAVPCGPLFQYYDIDACTHWPQAKAPTPMLEMAATPTGFFLQITKRKKHEVQRLTAPGEGAFSCGQSLPTIERHFFFAGRR
jgi:hypothetical protein